MAPDETPAAEHTATKGKGKRSEFVSTMPILTPGDAGPQVAALAALLADHGHKNAVAEGRAPAVLTDDLMVQVREFQRASGVDPTQPEPGGDASPHRNRDAGVVDARTWEALLGHAPAHTREG